MKQKIIFFDQTSPYLIFPAAALFLQLEGEVHIEPITATALSAVILEPKDELYVLDFKTNLNDERQLLDFELANKSQIRLWAGTWNGGPETCLSVFIEEGYHMFDTWHKIALEVFKNDLEHCSPQAERIIRAYKAQRALDFNLDHPSGIKKLIKKMLNELIAGDKNAEIDTLAAFQKAADEKLAAMFRFWQTASPRNPSYCSYPFHKIPLIPIEEGREIDSFLNIKALIELLRRRFSKSVSKFVLEYNCRGRVHYLLCGKDQISRHSYNDRISTQYLRVKAANKLL